MKSPHIVMGQRLEVSLAEDGPPEPEAFNLLLKNVPSGTDVEFLNLYIESVTGLSASKHDFEVTEKPRNLFLVVLKKTLGEYICEFINVLKVWLVIE